MGPKVGTVNNWHQIDWPGTINDIFSSLLTTITLVILSLFEKKKIETIYKNIYIVYLLYILLHNGILFICFCEVRCINKSETI